MAWVYILKNSAGKYYIGSTINLTFRLYQHKHGHTQTTKRMGEFELVFSQEYATLKEARGIEARLKRLKRKDYVEKIISDGFIKMK